MKKTTIGTLALAIAGLAGALAANVNLSKKASEEHKLAEKHQGIMLALDQWVAVKQDGKNLSEYFENNGYKTIAIYGMSYLGERLISELRGTEIQVAYGIDRNAANIYSEVELKTLDDDMEPVDAVIVTAISFFDEIEAEMEKKVDCPILSLEDVLYGI